MQPNMTQQYEAELKKLHAQIGSDAKAVDRQVRALDRRRKANDRERDRQLHKARVAAARAGRNILKQHRLHDRPLLAEINAALRARDRREAALHKRISILTGRLSS